MDVIHSSEDLMEQIKKLTNSNSVCQVFVPGKGQLTIVLQTNEIGLIAKEAQDDPELRKMLNESKIAYENGEYLSTDELIKSMSVKDFE
jgi:hypothetical protein